MQRVAVIGAVGSGKSTVAMALASQLGLPLVDLDRIYWESGSRPSEASWSATHGELIAGERWVLDGD
jgi:adenylate kinase family enzyme